MKKVPADDGEPPDLSAFPRQQAAQFLVTKPRRLPVTLLYLQITFSQKYMENAERL